MIYSALKAFDILPQCVDCDLYVLPTSWPAVGLAGMYEKGKGEHSAVVAQTRAQMASLLSAEGKKHEADSEMWQAVIATDWKGEAAKDPDAMQAVSKLADMMDGAEGESSAAASGR